MGPDPHTGTSTLPPTAEEVARSGYEHRPPARRSAGRAATKWFLAVPRLTSPAMLAEEAVDIGLTESARVLLVDGFASQLADERGTPEATIREVFDRSLT